MSNLTSVLIPDYSYEDLYEMFMRMPMKQLADEYQAAVSCTGCFYGVSEELVFSPLLKYIHSWIDVMHMVIAERVCKDCGTLSEGPSE